jgi:hypothetical protein
MGPWLGVATGPGIYILGGNLAANLPPLMLALVIPLGTLVLTSLIVMNGIASRRRREYLVAAVHRTLGRGLGARLLNLMMALSLIGWFSFYSGLSGFSLANLLGLPGWAGSLLLVLSMLLLSEVGLTRWNALVWVTTLAALASALIALFIITADPHPAAAGVVAAGPLFWGIGSIIAYSIVFAVRCSDFTWDLQSDREVVKSGAVFYLTVVIALLIGVALYRRTGEANLAELLARSGSAFSTLLGHVPLALERLFGLVCATRRRAHPAAAGSPAHRHHRLYPRRQPLRSAADPVPRLDGHGAAAGSGGLAGECSPGPETAAGCLHLRLARRQPAHVPAETGRR